MKNIAVFASGSGSNFQAMIDGIHGGTLQVNIALLVCDKPEATVIKRAMEHKIPVFVFSPKSYESKQVFEGEILQELKDHQVEFIALAGYMRLIGETLLEAFGGRIVNIHPSLLPSFPGKDAIGQALLGGVKVTGVTIHYVDAGMDTGPIIAQQAVSLSDDETEESLAKKIHEIEHSLYVTTLQKLLNEKGRESNHEKTCIG